MGIVIVILLVLAALAFFVAMIEFFAGANMPVYPSAWTFGAPLLISLSFVIAAIVLWRRG